jgi:sialate O-acetylesterase
MRNILVLIFFISFFKSYSQLSIDRLLTDHCILQRNKDIPIKGKTDANKKVDVSIDGKSYSGKSDKEGRFTVILPARVEGGPYTITISDGKSRLEIKDVYYGDVWLVSGQSNMEWTVDQSAQAAIEKLDADYPKIRHFKIDHRIELSPVMEVNSGSWVVADAQTIGNFSAVAVFFARKVYKETGIPIGILNSSWGGSQAESWISIEAMKSSHLRDYAAKYQPDWKYLDDNLHKNLIERFTGSRNTIISLETEQNYPKMGKAYRQWPMENPMGAWDWKGAWAWRGSGYIAREVMIPKDKVSNETKLHLASCYCDVEVYINGSKIGEQKAHDGVYSMNIPGQTWQEGSNDLMVKISKPAQKWWGVGLHGNGDDFKLILSTTHGLPLNDRNWHFIPAFASPHEYYHDSNNAGGIIYNAMIAPIEYFPIKGILWYQGETNASRPTEYCQTMELLIRSWREKRGENFPFYMVQLTAFAENNNSNEGSRWASVRECQQATVDRLPNTALVNIIDLGEQWDIHPRNKQDVGLRLAAYALRNDYRKPTEILYPRYEKLDIKGNQAIVHLIDTGGELVVRNKYIYAQAFEIAGEDRKWYYAQVIIEGDRVFLSHPKVPQPVAVRYAWSDAPMDANVFGKSGLPLRPFRTDKWPTGYESDVFK